MIGKTNALKNGGKPEQTKTVEFNPGSNNSVTITPDQGYVLSSAQVNKPTTMVPSNIKSGVNIGGVVGTFEGESNFVQKTCSSKNLNSSTRLGTTGDEQKVCDATFSKSVRVNHYDYYYFATITASKMYYNGTDLPEQQLIQIGSATLYYGSSGSTIDAVSIYMYRNGNVLYLTFHQGKDTIKLSYTSRTLIPVATITFSNDAKVASQRPSLGTFTSYTQVYGQTTSSIRDYPVIVPSDATKILNAIQFTYDGSSSFAPNVNLGTLA